MRSRFHFDIWEAYDQVVISLFLIGLIALLFSSCASKKVLVPEVHERIVHQRDTIYRVDSVLTSTTTIIRQADSTMMADYGIRIGKQEKAWLVKQDQDTRSASTVRFIMRIDSIVHDSIPKFVPKNVYVEKGEPWYEKVLVFLGICDVAVALIWAYCKLSERARKIK
jgi:hypothetical protein